LIKHRHCVCNPGSVPVSRSEVIVNYELTKHSFDELDSQHGNLSNPASWAFVSLSDDAKRTFLGVERLALARIRQNDFACGKCGVKFRKSEDDLIAITRLGFREARARSLSPSAIPAEASTAERGTPSKFAGMS
jgi:hypothetical protein